MKNASLLQIATAVLIAMLVSLNPGVAVSQQAAKHMEAVTPQIHQIISGGFWEDANGKQSGFYRAGVVMEGDAKTLTAQLFIQWLAIKPGTADARIIRSEQVQEVAAQKLQNAFVTLDAGEKNVVRLIVSSFDIKAKKEKSLTVEARLPSEYRLLTEKK